MKVVFCAFTPAEAAELIRRSIGMDEGVCPPPMKDDEIPVRRAVLNALFETVDRADGAVESNGVIPDDKRIMMDGSAWGNLRAALEMLKQEMEPKTR